MQSIFDARSTLTQRTEGPKCSGVASLFNVSHMKEGDRADLAAYYAEPGTIAVVAENDRKYLVMTDRNVEKARTELSAERVYLYMDCDFTTDDARFYYNLDDRMWTPLGDKFQMIFCVVHFSGNKFVLFKTTRRRAPEAT